MPDRGLEGREPVLFMAKIGRHATAVLQTTVKRHPTQASLQVIGPLMIRTREAFNMPPGRSAQLHTAVRTAVDEDIHGPVLIPDHDDGSVANGRLLKITRLRDLHFQPNVRPALPTENQAHLLLIDLGIS